MVSFASSVIIADIRLHVQELARKKNVSVWLLSLLDYDFSLFIFWSTMPRFS